MKILTAITLSLGLAISSQTLAEIPIQSGSTQQIIEGPYTTNLEAGEFFQLGMRYYDLGNFKAAEIAMTQAVDFDPAMSMAYYMLGNALLYQDENGQAAAQYQQALRLDPNMANGYNNLGVALYRLGRYEDAIAAYKRAIALEPKLADTFFNLGIVYQQSQQSKRAILNLEQAKSFYQEQNNLDKATEVNVYIQCNIIPTMVGRKPAFPEVCPEIFAVTTRGVMRRK